MSREKSMRKVALAVVILSVFLAGISAGADPPIPQNPPAPAESQTPATGATAETVPATDNQAIYEGKIREITVSSTEGFTNVEAVIEGKIGTYNSIKLDDPFRIVVDIPGVEQGTAASEIPVGTPQVKTVRLTQEYNNLRMTVETPKDRAVPFLVTLEGNRLILSVGGGQEEKVASFDRDAAAKVPATAKPAKSKPPVHISMDFTDVDLPVLIKFISEQTKKNFIFDERIQGKITIISPRRITLDEAYNVFLSVLHVKGFATVEQDNTIKIIPLRDIKQAGLPTETGKREVPGARFITRLIPLQYVNVAEIIALLTPLVSKEGLITSFPPSNTLILIDSRANIDKVLGILAEIDREGTGTTMRLFSLKNASVAEIVKTLDLLYRETGTPQAPAPRGRAPRPGKVRGSAPKFIPDTRTNIMIVIAGQEVMSDIENLIAKLDIPTPENTGKINVYYLENAEAEEVAKVLASLTERKPGTRQPAAGRAPTIKGIIAAELEGGVKITADKATNSLIIIASLNDYQTLVEVIRKLDIRRRQVYVEAVVMEISLDNTRDLGVEWRGAFETGSDGAVLGGTNFGFQGNLNELLLALASGNPLLFSGTGLIAAGVAGNVTLPDGTEIPAITAVLRAAQTSENINILSTPHLLTLDNKEAEIIVAEEVPFITSQSRDSTNLANVINTVEREDVGIILRITPRINESDFVSLDIYQESSALVGGQSILVTSEVGPTTTKRSARTSVLVKDQETVVLGGMMQETVNNIETKVPFLGDIPILGNLFKFSSVNKSKTNLLIFLTPHIIKNPGDISEMTSIHQKQMDDFIKKHTEKAERIFPEMGPDEEGE
jgi:general secretion pathway protein D